MTSANSTSPAAQASPSIQTSREGKVKALKERIETGLFAVCCFRLAGRLIEQALILASSKFEVRSSK